VNLLQLAEEERVVNILPVRTFEEGKFVFTATAQGVVKKSPLMDYSRPRAGGIIAMGLREGDRLIATAITSGEDEIFLSTREGMSIRFRETDVRPMGREAVGVRGIDLEEGDILVGMEVILPGGTLLTVTERGYGKRTDVDEYRFQGRGGKGVITLKVTKKTGSVAGVAQVGRGDEVMLVADGGKIIRLKVDEIRVIGRNTQGVRLIGLEEGERLVSVARLAEREE
jgi:DNA gyrase subunit A